MSSSVQFDNGNTRIDSPGLIRVLKNRHGSGRWLRGSQTWLALRNEKIRSFARGFSSSRRAPPIAASNPWRSSACFSASVFITSRMHRRTGGTDQCPLAVPPH